jgi:FkbM family methyltransferase
MLNQQFSNDPDIKLFNVAAGSRIFETEMNVEAVNKGQSNSILKPKGHLKQHPEIKFSGSEKVTVLPIDTLGLNPHLYNMMMLDCQGYELEILKGSTETLKHIDFIYTEVNRGDVYENCAKVWEIDEYLSDFDRVETAEWVGDWSDAFYIRKNAAA